MVIAHLFSHGKHFKAVNCITLKPGLTPFLFLLLHYTASGCIPITACNLMAVQMHGLPVSFADGKCA